MTNQDYKKEISEISIYALLKAEKDHTKPLTDENKQLINDSEASICQ